VKASANKNKKRKEQAKATARIYDEQLRKEINADREAHGKKPLKEKEREEETQEKTVSETDPECGLYQKGEHEVQFAYEAHTVCDKHGFILGYDVTAGNVHDSVAFDAVYEEVIEKFPQINTLTMDAAYKTPWICKRIIDDGRQVSLPYKRPMTKDGFFRKYEYVYDEYYDCILCPANQVLKYATTNRDGYREYKSDPKICVICPYLSQCTCSKNHQKTVTRHIWEDYIEQAEDFRHTPEGKASYEKRKNHRTRIRRRQRETRYAAHEHVRFGPGSKLGRAKVRCHEPQKVGRMDCQQSFTAMVLLFSPSLSPYIL